MMSLFEIPISALIVILITPIVQQLGNRWGWVDQPGGRKVHHQPIVRMGGVAICIGTITTWFLSWQLGIFDFSTQQISSQFSFIFSQNFSTEELKAIATLFGGLGFFLIGLIDDRLSLSPLVRLLFQAMITGIVWKMGLRIDTLPIPGYGLLTVGYFSLPITFLWLAGVANAINWMDGLDGLASGIATIAALGLSVSCVENHHPAIALLSLGLAGATLGFLRYNAAPAQIFMGDGGSYFIGFVLAAVSIAGCMQESQVNAVMLPYVILAVPIFDMIWVILSRVMEGKSPFFGDRRHLHHRLLHMGFSRAITVLFISGLTLWFSLGAVALAFTSIAWFSLALSTALFCLTHRSIGTPLVQWIKTGRLPSLPTQLS